MENFLNDNNRNKKLCKYCAEEIYEEAVLCRFCGKKQKTVINKVGDNLEENRGQNDMNKSYWILIWLPSILIMGLSFFVGSMIPAIIGAVYWSYMYYKYDMKF